MIAKPLSNESSILVTRPNPGGENLCAFLQQKDVNALHFPTIEIEPLLDFHQSKNAVAHFFKADWLIFTSPHAVWTVMPMFTKIYVKDNQVARFAAIGEGTRSALAAYGIENIHVPDDWNSERLLALSTFQSVSNQKIIIIKGQEGRDLLQKTFERRGAIVTNLIAYRRTIPDIDPTPFTALMKKNAIHGIVCASFTSINHLKQMIGSTHWHNLQMIPLIVISHRIKTLAESLNFQTIWVADNASPNAIFNLITQKGRFYGR